MMRKIGLSLIVSLALFSFACGTINYNQVMEKPEGMYYKGQFKEAARMLLPHINKVDDKDKLIFLMEAGLMLNSAQDYENSNKVLLEAGKIADQINIKIGKEITGLFLNESATNYTGEDFERVLIHMYLGINFLFLNKPDSARVEFKKVNDVLRDINVSGGKAYKQNIMAKYLTAIAFELIAEKENDDSDRNFAYVEYKQIHELDPRLAMAYRDLQRYAKRLGDEEDYKKWTKKFGKRDDIPADNGELVVIYQSGKAAIKVSRGPLLSDAAMSNGINAALKGMPLKQGVSVAAILIALKQAHNPIPKYQKRQNAISHLVININGKDVDRTIILEDIENTALKNLEEQYPKIVGKVAAGLAVKAATALAAGFAAEAVAKQFKQTQAFAGIIGKVAGAGTGAALLANIKPDLRCWHTLPANLQLSRIFLAPGEYKVQVKLIDQAGRVYKDLNYVTKVEKNKKNFFNIRTLF